jgi:glycosyltransferase involved in cell wall biosynthesis
MTTGFKNIMQAKKILYITPGLNIGGAEKFIITLSDALSKDTTSQTIVSLTEHNALQPELNKNVRLVPLPRRYKLDRVPVLKLRQLIKTEKPDVIFCVNFFTWFFTKCATFFSSANPKRIISYHSTIHVSRKEYLMHKFYRMLLTKKDLIVTVSSNQETYTAKQLRIPVTKFKTIHNGIDTQYWRLPPAGDETFYKIRSAYNIPPAAKVIIKAASFRVEKNHTGAVRALQILHTVHHNKAYLLFLGDGPMLPEVKKLATEMGLQDYVIFAGMQKNVRPFYWASDLFTLCSTSVETFSIAALEAMACGLPCVLTDIGGASEMIAEGKTGYLCTPGDEDIAQTWHKALSHNFDKEKIYCHVATHFSAGKMVEEYKKIL